MLEHVTGTEVIAGEDADDDRSAWRFEHPDIGVFALFIAPVGGDGNALQYEAVFNRLLPGP